MSETPAPSKGQPITPQGQIEAPNPLELFWEKQKRWVLAAAAVVALGLGANYVVAYYKQQEVDERWTAFAEATNLDRGYAQDGSLAFFLQQAQQQSLDEASQQRALQSVRMYLQITRGELTTEVQEDIEKIDPEVLQAQIASAKGTAAEPLLLWVKAIRAVHLGAWDDARATLDTLEKGFPEHFLCLSTPYPPQARAEVEKKDSENAEEPPPRPKRGEGPKLVPAVAGSPVSLLRSQIDREEQFQKTEPKLYEAPEPDAEPEVVIRFAPMDEEVKIRFYKDAAPEHVANFLALVRKKNEEGKSFYEGQRIDEVQRAPANAANPQAPRQLHFGLAASKDDDRTKWDEAKGKESGVVLEFEDNGLSHFPGMVAAAPETGADGKSSGERIWITANDAVQFDGQRVIFGRVVEGLDVINEICDRAFVEDNMETNGRGKLQTNVTIDSITIVNDVPPPEEPKDEENGDKENEKEGGK
jgi:cyclophilin family peptidyl-prolyl cis-trans isomerase